MKPKGRKHTESLDIVIISIIAIIYAQLSFSFHFIEVIYDFSRKYGGSATVEFLANFIFLLLAGLLWMTYRRWRSAQRRENELERVIESIIPQVNLILGPDQEILACNSFVKVMFDYEKEEVIGRKASFLYVEHKLAPEYEPEVCKILEEREGFHISMATGRKKDGTPISLEVTAGGLEEGRGSVVVLHKIIEKKA
ncbi:MAG: hypothetical protein C0399_12265 [Syntrophus sp. (in: bacteria)]|nr:hypothetical protein [Syntrophus sp. (in: bacteria)]MBA4419085.1 hypothetical protein [Syntrophus sp. (in: bacteria)]